MNTSLLSALKECGIAVKEVETVKNGISCTGYQIDTGTNVKPVIYHSPEETIEAFVARAREIAKIPVPQIDVETIMSREYLLDKTIVCLQKNSNERICKRDFLDLEMYVRIEVDFADGTSGSIKVTHEILDNAGISEEALLEAAISNSEKKACISTMAEALGMIEDVLGENLFYVATYQDKAHGAGIMAVTETLHDFCEKKGFSKIYILPSSTEEVLLLPHGLMDPENLAGMVNSVNLETVDPLLQLNPTVYLYDDALREVTIAHTYN
jgi:hypothetical protein